MRYEHDLASSADPGEPHQSPISDNDAQGQLDPQPFLRSIKGELQRSRKLKSSYLILKSYRCWGTRWPKEPAGFTAHRERELLSFPTVSSAEGFLKRLRIIYTNNL